MTMCMGITCTYVSHIFLGTHHHFDTIAYPKSTKTRTFVQKAKDAIAEKGLFGATLGALKGLFKGGQSSSKDAADVKGEEFKPPGLNEMCRVCLLVYLEENYGILSTCDFPPRFNIATIVEQINSVYCSLKSPTAIHDHSHAAIDRPQQDMRQVSSL